MNITHRVTRAYRYCVAHPAQATLLLGGIALLLVVFFIQKNGAPDEIETETPDKLRTVRLTSVAALSASSDPLVVVGEVRSASQAELRAQKPGQITGVYVRAGQQVGAGTLIADIENAQERAMLEVARAGLLSAQAQLDKVRAGARPEERTTVEARTEGARAALATAQQAGNVAYLQAYAVARDAVFTTADTFFTNAYTVRPSLRVRNATYTERTALETERVALASVFEAWEARTASPLSDESIDASLKEAFDTLERVRTYIATLQTLVSRQETNTDFTVTEKAAQESALAGTRAGIDATKGALTSAMASLTQTRTEVLVSGETERTVSVGARDEDIALAEASVAQARGSIRSAEATLAISQIRTPIAGTLSTLSISRGDFVSGQQPVGVVANKNTQEVEVYVSDAVRERIQEGMPVIIKGTDRGTVSNVSPGLDSVSKKARVLIRIEGDATLVQGAYVEVAFIPDSTTQTRPDQMYVPLSAVKVIESGLAVFTVDENNILTALPITEGPIRGAEMRVRDGVTPETRIVEDVRGLRAGDTVAIADSADTDTQ